MRVVLIKAGAEINSYLNPDGYDIRLEQSIPDEATVTLWLEERTISISHKKLRSLLKKFEDVL